MERKRFIFDKGRKRKFSCVNCGKEGHVYKNCPEPITSFGILAVKKRNLESKTGCIKNIKRKKCSLHENAEEFQESIKPKNKLGELLYLMIQRKDTMGYIDLIRGKYPEDPIQKNKLIKIYLEEMTCEEREKILIDDFEDLWDKIWLNRNYKYYMKDFKEAKIKFLKLDVKELLKSTKCNFFEPEFTFPKGRKNMNEENINCAIREFTEETGYKEHHINIISNEEIEESFIGTNGLPYKHIYYVAEIEPHAPLLPVINDEEIQQIGEVSNCGWFTYKQCMNLIRYYDVEKKNMLTRVNEKLTKKHSTFGI